ncbi:MAG: hypothetical protein M1825_003504 [Sarcosagium campestre]|nr:MAG: hypothetical protein M1825_003504 [Sarcosagium campestre]
MDVPVAANVLGTLGAVCWSVQLIPQIVINYRRHQTDGLQSSMMMLWAIAGVPLGIYNIVQEFNIALRIQPQILTLLSLATWAQCCYYGNHWPIKKCAVFVIPIAALFGGVEVALILALRIALQRDIKWPLTLMAVLSAVLLAAGVLRHYWDIYTHKTVRGISFIFVGIDAAGDIFSLISVLFQPSLDVLGLVIYGTELVLWIGVLLCGGYYNILPRLRRGIEVRAEAATIGHSNNAEISLRDLPSSTSVFQTPSMAIAIARGSATSQSSQIDDRSSRRLPFLRM